jgi:hypothetical protein
MVGVSFGVLRRFGPGWPACTSQGIDALLPQFAAVTVDSVELDGDLVTFRVRAKASDAACSGCRRRSSRVHARYQRQLADLPLGGRRVQVIAHIRRGYDGSIWICLK